MSNTTKFLDYAGLETFWSCILSKIEDSISDLETSESINIDTTLTVSGSAADAKIVGDNFNSFASTYATITSLTETTNTLDALNSKVNTILDIGEDADTTLDQLTEIVAYIKNNKSLIDSVTTAKQNTITGAATTITNSNLAANYALISNSSGKVAISEVTTTELGYLSGVTSNIQTQLTNLKDEKLNKSDKYILPVANSSTLGGVKTGELISNTSGYTPVHIDSSGKIYYKDTNNTYSLSSFGITASAAELNYMDGVTSNVQTQLNSIQNSLDGKIENSALNSYIKGLSVSGKTITYTKGDNTTGTITTQDTTYTNSEIRSILGASQLTGQKGDWLLTGDGWIKLPTNEIFATFTGATASTNGTSGMVPVPYAGSQNKFLRGDGTWATSYTLPTATASTKGGVTIGNNISVSSGTISLTKTNITNALGFTPANANTVFSTATKGLVPSPTVAQVNSDYFLKADGSWSITPYVTYNNATTSYAGLMSADDKTKLDNIDSAYLSINGGTLTGDLHLQGDKYPSFRIYPKYTDTTKFGVFECAYYGVTSMSCWEDTQGSNRRVLEVRATGYAPNIHEAVALRVAANGEWATYLMYHQGNVIYSSTQPSDTKGMIWLEPNGTSSNGWQSCTVHYRT